MSDVPTVSGVAVAPPPNGDRSRRRWLRRLLRSTPFVVGALIVATVVVASLAAPLITPYNPVRMSAADRFQGPSLVHPFGTDQLGRDVLARVLHGGRMSLPMGVAPIAVAAVAGLILGLMAGYYGGLLDLVIMRIADVWIAFPPILLAMAIVTVLGTGLVNIMIALGIAWVPYYARMVRASVLEAKERVYVDAAHALGSRDLRIVVRHVLPNVLTPIMVMSSMGVANAILAGAALSFLGLGAQAPAPEWGTSLADARQFMRLAWWIGFFPGIAIALTVLGANLMGDGIRDALDPKLKI
ncbi:MAG: ABC transporter permease [Trueperaceae bacterium]|nr:ABC transporter permease [Trueperaceae bacterium]